MADRDAAEIFSRMFEILAEKTTRDRRDMASELWESTKDYDFTPDQMGCDDALIALELAEECPQCRATIFQDEDHLPVDCG